MRRSLCCCGSVHMGCQGVSGVRRALCLSRANPGRPGHVRPPASSTWGIPCMSLTISMKLTTVAFRCGNGLLTHILTMEGYSGHGVDVRARTSWSHYPELTQAQLHVESLDPTSCAGHPYLRHGVFIIANHADELTPWTPVLATLHGASGYLSIPCCAWAFDAKYERASTSDYPMPGETFVDGLNLGGDGSNSSSYSRYRIWLASLSLYCGWRVECETLRIPSTRNWATVGEF